MHGSVSVSMNGVGARVAALLLLMVICTSCGETYRPVAFPIPPNPPNPGAFHYVLTLSGNGLDSASTQPPFPGTASRIDTSGDTTVSAFLSGMGPVHGAILPNGNAVYVANSLEDTVTAGSPSSTTATTIALPDTLGNPNATPPVPAVMANPVFVHTTENGKVYVANYNYGTVSVINTSFNLVTTNVSVDPSLPNNPTVANTVPKPVVLAELPNAQKLYSVNAGNGTVTSINTSDDSRNPLITIGGSPVWAAARSDSQRVFVLDKTSGKIYAIDPTTTPDTLLPGSASTAPGSDFMLYDAKLNRLYVTNSAGGTFWAFDASSNTLPILLDGPIPIAEWVPSSPLVNPCAGTPVVPVSLTPLIDGSRVYVASYQLSSTSTGSVICPQVTSFSSSNFTSPTTISILPVGTDPVTGDPVAIPVAVDTTDPTGCLTARPATSPQGPAGFRLSLAAAGDSKTVYAASCDAANTTAITTVAITIPGFIHQPDTVLTTLNPPLSAFPAPPPPAPVNGICPNSGEAPSNGLCPQPPPPPQNPLFIFPGP